MDAITTIQKLKDRISAFTIARGWHPSARGIAISITIEAAELLEHYQWDDYANAAKTSQDAKVRREAVADELADIMIYCLEFAMAENIDISEAVSKKLNKNARKYPAHLFKGSKDGANAYYYGIKRKIAAAKKK